MPKKSDKNLDGELLNCLCSVFQTRMNAFSNYSNQVWNRFNWLLTLQVGIAGLFLTNYSSASDSSKGTIILALMVCILWLLMGIEDWKNLKQHSERVKICHVHITNKIEPFAEGISEHTQSNPGVFSFRQTWLLFLFPSISLIGWLIILFRTR